MDMQTDARTIPARYDGLTIAFHWLTAALVVLLFASAELWPFLPRGAPRRTAQGLHISMGILLTAAILGRMLWRARWGRRLAALPSRALGRLSSGVHFLLYALLATQAVLGFVLRWAQGEPFFFFGLFPIPQAFATNLPLADTVENLHNITAWTIIAVALCHAAAALFHHYVLKDGVLGRMKPAT